MNDVIYGKIALLSYLASSKLLLVIFFYMNYLCWARFVVSSVTQFDEFHCILKELQ